MNSPSRRDFLKAAAAACVLPVLPPSGPPLVVPTDWFRPPREGEWHGGYADCDICYEPASEGIWRGGYRDSEGFWHGGEITQMYRTTDALPYLPITVCEHCVRAGRHLES